MISASSFAIRSLATRRAMCSARHLKRTLEWMLYHRRFSAVLPVADIGAQQRKRSEVFVLAGFPANPRALPPLKVWRTREKGSLRSWRVVVREPQDLTNEIFEGTRRSKFASSRVRIRELAQELWARDAVRPARGGDAARPRRAISSVNT